ncbi:spore germination protein GerPE [Paenibacillus gansuensis]|uniref:Spore germination protein GerPE n=1 Tax=Paenibacillus gansuensis TaxID=306542 RepID=A0ABW5PFK0_9BACL
MVRTSEVTGIDVDSIAISSTLFIGDMLEFKPKSNVLAVQRQVAEFWGEEGDLEAFPIFRRPIPQPVIYEPLELTIHHSVPVIKVGFVKVFGISTSALVQVGSTAHINLENRTKHIRQLVTSAPPAQTSVEIKDLS